MADPKVLVRSKHPSEEDPTYNIEVFTNDGSIPEPRDAIAMALQALKRQAIRHELVPVGAKPEAVLMALLEYGNKTISIQEILDDESVRPQ